MAPLFNFRLVLIFSSECKSTLKVVVVVAPKELLQAKCREKFQIEEC